MYTNIFTFYNTLAQINIFYLNITASFRGERLFLSRNGNGIFETNKHTAAE